MTLPLTSPFTTGTAVTKGQLDQLVTAVNTLYAGAGGARMQYTQTTAQTLTASAYTVLTNFTQDFDTLFGFNATTGVWACSTTGQYEISGQVNAAIGSARVIPAIGTSTSSQIYRNEMTFPTTGGSGTTGILVPKEFTVTAGTTLSLMAFVSTSVSTGLSNNSGSFLRIKHVG